MWTVVLWGGHVMTGPVAAFTASSRTVPVTWPEGCASSVPIRTRSAIWGTAVRMRTVDALPVPPPPAPATVCSRPPPPPPPPAAAASLPQAVCAYPSSAAGSRPPPTPTPPAAAAARRPPPATARHPPPAATPAPPAAAAPPQPAVCARPSLAVRRGTPQRTGSSSTWVTSSATLDRSERCRVMWAKRSFSLSASTTEAMPS